MTLEQTPLGPQLTIGGLLAALDELQGSIPVHVAGFGNDSAPFELRRHTPRGNGTAIHARGDRDGIMSVGRFKVMLAQHASQSRTPSNPDPTTMDSPLWVGGHSLHLEFRAVVGVGVFGGIAHLQWVDVAPVQGPSLQRITDVEVLLRNAELAGRTDPNLDPESAGNRWLLAHMPKERDRARVRLSEARNELARIAREVAALETTAADYDYTLGLTDVSPRLAEEVRP